MTPRLGFVGLGQMGLPMLENLCSGGDLPVMAHDLADAPFDRLAGHPAWGRSLRRADGLGGLAGASHVIVMLPDSTATNRVIEGGDGAPGLATILAPGARVIDMGSSDPAQTVRLGTVLDARGIALTDAPVSGTVTRARAGTLSILAGCDAATLEGLRPILSRMGTELIATGRLGAGHAMKALNNYVYAAGLLAASEALCIADRLELDLGVFAQVLNASSGRNVATETKIVQAILPGRYDGGFALALQAKDLATAARLQDRAGCPAAQLDLCTRLWTEAVAALPAGADNTEIHRYLDRNAPAGPSPSRPSPAHPLQRS
ncbi:MAG: NAD(P)-dependent oxidoreductase [Alkalilacustris sp.]